MIETDETRDFELVELARRLANLVRIGTVHEVDESVARVRVQYAERSDGEPVLTDWLPWITTRAGQDRTWWAPTVGEQVVLSAPSGDLAQAVALPALYQSQYPAPRNDPNKQTIVFSDDAWLEYDREAHHLKAVLPSGGTADLVADGGVRVQGDTTIVGDLRVEGQALVTKDITGEQEVIDQASSMQDMRDRYNSHSHTPTGPSPRM